jgi:hypothetical protein
MVRINSRDGGHREDTYLLHSKWMDDLTPIISELSRLSWRNDRDESRRWHFSRVSRENSVNFFPYLQFGSRKANGQKSREQISISSTYLTE